MKFDYPSPQTAECPYPLYRWARSECPVPKIPEHEAYFISRYEDVLFVAQNPEIFSSVGRSIGTRPSPARRTAGGLEVRAMLETDPPAHIEHRRISTRNLNPKTFRDSAPMVLRHVTALIDAFVDKGECEFIDAFANPLPALVVCDLMGLPTSFADRLREWEQIEIQGIMFYPAERRQRQWQVYEEFKAYVEQALVERRDNPTDDALGRLVSDQIERDGEFDLEYVKSQAVVLVSGGLITTAHLIGQTMLLLLQHPEQLQMVLAEPKRIANAIDEALRLESPVQWVPRRVTRDIEVGGRLLPAGSHVLIGMGSANRDDAKFADPDRFDINRSDAAQHVAFGRGAHFCVGAPLARLEATIGFEQLFRRLRNIRLSPSNDFRHLDSPAFRGLQRLHLEFEGA